MKKGFAILVCLALSIILFASQTGALAAVNDSIDVPVWEVGDQWCMGYEDTLDESDMDMDMTGGYFEMDRLDVDGKLGYYRAMTVEDDDTVITIDETDYTCYDVYYEEYIAMSGKIDIAMSMDFSDLMDEYGYEVEDSDVDMSMFEDMSMSMVMKGYMWYDLEITGHIFYTVEDLSIAKGSFDFILNSDVDMTYDISYSGAIFEGIFDDEYDYGTRAQSGYQYDSSDDESSEETRIYYKLKQTITDWSASYDIIYNPPLNFFEFPIYKYDTWSASADMTLILNQLSGTITYDYSMDYGYGTPQSDQGTVQIGDDLSLPQTFGPEWIDYSFRCSDIDEKPDTDGTETDCYLIEPYGYWGYWDDYEEGGLLSNYWEASAYVDMDMESPSVIGMEDIGGNDQPNPIDAMARAENWYSFDSANVVSFTPPEADESGMFAEGEDELEAQTYNEVTTFKEVTRDDIKSDYEDYKASIKESSDSDDENSWLFWVFLIAVIIVVILVLVIALWARKRKRQRTYWQQQYGYGYPQGQPPSPQYQPPGERGVQPSGQAPPSQGQVTPKIVRQPIIVNTPQQQPPQPQPQQQPYYPPPQQQPQSPPPQQPNYPPPPPQGY
jgi:hypothetical protein